MRTYSAGEAIGPAWQHTRALLFQGRRWGRVLKICFVALGAQLTFSFNANLNLGGQRGSTPPAMLPMLALFAVMGAVFSLVFGIAMLYLGSRLQLALFDIVLLRDDRVGPAWSRHGRQAWRWAGLKLAGMAGIALLLSPLLIPLVGGTLSLMRHLVPTAAAPHPDFSFAALRAVAVLLLELFAVFLFFSVFYRLYLAVTLPGVALEDLRFGPALRRAGEILRADVPQMATYAVLQMLLLFALGMAALLLWAVVVGIPGVLLATAGWAAWHGLHGSFAGMFVAGTLGAIAGIALLLWAVLLYFVLVGSLIVFSEAYAQYFVAGRYPLMGRYLEPAAAPLG